MRILIVAATAAEIAPLTIALKRVGTKSPRVDGFELATHAVDVLITGVGMVATAAWCSRALSGTVYDLALNLGVCGSFDSSIQPGAVVHVVSDRLTELGAEDGDAFLPVDQLGLESDFEIVNSAPPSNVALAQLPAVRGITVNTVHGRESSIAETVRRFAPQVESMEGAAFMYACTIGKVPFAEVRAVSNVVERRNRARWKMSEAIDRLGQAARDILNHAS